MWRETYRCPRNAISAVRRPEFLLSLFPQFFLTDVVMVNPIRHWLAAILCAGSLMAPRALSHEGGRSFTVRVLALPDRDAVSGAVIRVNETGERSRSDSSGRCVLHTLDNGISTLLIHRIGFRDIEFRIARDSLSVDTASVLMQPSPFQTGEVIARSTRTGGPANTTPFPVEIQQRDRISFLRPVSVPDIVAATPGVTLSHDGIWETAISIRGLKQSHVVSLIDGVRIETATDIAGVLSLMNLNDIDRIETIKTSGSVLYGTGAVGGIVDVITRQPAFSEELQIHGETVTGASSVDNGFSQYLAVEGSAEGIAGRVSGGVRKAANTQTPSGLLQNSQYGDFTLSGNLLVRTIGNQSLDLSFQRAQAEDAGIPGGSPFSSNATATYTLARRQRFSAEYRIPNPAPGVGLISVLVAHQEIERNVSVVQSPTLTLTPHAVHTTNSVTTSVTFAPWETDILAAGIDVWQRTLVSKREKRNLATMTITGERPLPDSKFLCAGVYAQNEWRPGSMPVTLVAGARYDGIQVSNADSWNPDYVERLGDGQPVNTSRQLLWASATSRNASWSLNAGVRTDLSPEVDVSFLAGSAYRSPSLEERFQYIDLGSVVLVGDPGLRPERSLALNLGAHVHDAQISVRADAFLTVMRDLVSSIPGSFEGRSALINANIGAARLYGGEASIDLAPSQWSGVRASVSYVRGRDTRANANLTQIPPLLARFELRRRVATVGTFACVLDCAATQGDPGPGETRVPGHGRLDVEYSADPISIGGWSFLLRSGVENVFNKDYTDFLSTLRGFVRSEAGRNLYLYLTVNV